MYRIPFVVNDPPKLLPDYAILVPQVSPTVAAIVTGRIERQSATVGEPSWTIAGGGSPEA